LQAFNFHVRNIRQWRNLTYGRNSVRRCGSIHPFHAHVTPLFKCTQSIKLHQHFSLHSRDCRHNIWTQLNLNQDILLQTYFCSAKTYAERIWGCKFQFEFCIPIPWFTILWLLLCNHFWTVMYEEIPPIYEWPNQKTISYLYVSLDTIHFAFF
jgi:hypothetical protein